MHQSSLDNMAAFRNEFLTGRESEPLQILDLGSCDVNGSYKRFFDSPSWRYIGIDMAPGNNVDIVLTDPYNWREIESSSVDVVVSGQAFEHIEYIWLAMQEIARVIKPGGLCCIVAPSGGFEHRYPVDCWRFYPDGFSALARYAKLDVLKAFTQWESKGRYTDDSDKWKDTVLICRKPPVSSGPQAGAAADKACRPEAEARKGMTWRPVSFDLLAYSDALMQEPGRLSDVASWQEHIPFAFVLIQMLRPKVLVELGTHKGDSYLAFCQAVNALGTATRCHAVDTWKGEEHAGFYDEEIYDELKRHHDSSYGRFSTLHRCTFDEALDRFQDGSVDLLHIDGFHSYEAVKHDFETWLPKMSASGVVLIHDISVRERGFGVFRFWEEIKRNYRHYYFQHGNGLGVLFTGTNFPDSAQRLLSLSEDDAQRTRNFFYMLGHRITQISELKKQLLEKDGQIAERDRRIQALLYSLSWRMTSPLRKIYSLVSGNGK